VGQTQNNKPFSFYSLSLPYGPRELKEGLKRIVDHIGPTHILRQGLFYPPHIKKGELLDIIRGIYRDGYIPVTSLICQPMADDMDIGIELWGTDLDVQYISDNISVCDIFGIRWAFVAGIEPDSGLSFHEQVDFVLNMMRKVLNKAGFGFQHLIRTWYYIGGILKKEQEIVRYDLLNRARNKFYDVIWEEKREYPASTGIGTYNDNIVMDGIALSPSSGARVIRLENPLQISAFDYDIPFEKRPRFCRAILVENNGSGIIFVSGTASIRGADVSYPDNVEDQTYVTIENIKRLISRDNLSRYGIDWDISLNDVKDIRVYVKDKSYYPKVREICSKFFGNIPQLYLVADICRPTLLVEIEAVVIKGSA